MPTIDISDGVPLDGYYIDELPRPKKKEKRPQKTEREVGLELPLQEHDWAKFPEIPPQK